MKTRDFISYLILNQCYFHRQAGNSHAIYASQAGKASIPTNHRTMAPGTIRSVCKELGVANPNKEN